MATKEYLKGIYVIPPIVIGIFLHSLYDVFSAVAFFHKQSARIMMASVIAAVSNIILNYICIKQFGFIAAGYTTMASNLILTILNYINMRKIESEKIYDLRFVIYAVAGVSCGCLACNFLYNINSIIRYALIIVVLAVVYRLRRKVITAINNMKV